MLRRRLLACVLPLCVAVSAYAQDGTPGAGTPGGGGTPPAPTTTTSTADRDASEMPAELPAENAADGVEGTDGEGGEGGEGGEDGEGAADAPLLTGIDILQREYFRDETFRSFLQSKVGAPVDVEVLQADAQYVTDQYRARGYLQALVTVRTVPDATGRRALFDVRAGERAELKEVHVVGNHEVREEDLREGFFSRPPEFFGALTRAGLFHKPFLDQDQQRLAYNYFKRGYLEARVVETRVTASSDLSGLQVTLDVVEGPRYELIGIQIAGELPEGDTGEALRDRLSLKDGDVADLVTLGQQADPLLDGWRELGFPFARFEQQLAVGPPPSGNAEHKGIAVTLKMVKGPPAVVREVRVVGNKGTMPHVFLRELEVDVGAIYDHRALKRSEKNLLQTGLLQAAQGRAVPVTAADQAASDLEVPEGTALVDVEFAVTETTTWLLSPAFFGDANEGFIFVGVAGDRNLLGTGLQGFASVQWSALRFLFDVSLTEPRLLGTRSQATVEAHRRELRYRDFTIASVAGGSARANYAHELGYRFGGIARAFVGGGVGVEYGGVVDVDGKPLTASDLLPKDTFRNTLELRAGYDSREGGLSPRNGVLLSASLSTAGPWTASGLTFLDGQANMRLFWSPLWDITLKSNTQVGGVVNPLGGQAPVTDRYFLGGLGTVRGFFPRSIGPLQTVRLADGGAAELEVGGVLKVVQNVEVEAPLWPGSPLRGFAFADFGNAFGEDELSAVFSGTIERQTEFLVLDLMMSTGFGVLIETPILPFRLEWSLPVTRRSFDQPINFFLGVGSAF